ncbi:MAG: alanine--tRNA ligase, partial [Rhodospirillales bacterium]|nr:alanine--tRNA ligase [Rhodospirillales bacterium]
RIMRRAMRHANMIGCTEPHMHKLVPTLVSEMGQAFPELPRAQALVTETLKLEEERFMKTLSRGLVLLADAVDRLPDNAVLPGETAFKLYDTFGFPLDLTEDALRAQGREVDVGGFNQAMERQRADARAAWTGSGEAATETIWFDVREAEGATEFLGYDTEQAEGKVVAIVVDGATVPMAEDGAQVSVITNQTPFYGESGGQVGDTGTLHIAGGGEVVVEGTLKKLGVLQVHVGRVVGGTLTVGDEVHMVVDSQRRGCIRANHSVTHLLHQALRDVLGDHVTQKGSLVAPDRLRFDVSHPKPISAAELAQVEQEVNEVIRQNSGVATTLMTPDEAVAAGALALFGEKYGDEVRVVRMGKAAPAKTPGANTTADRGSQPFSVELCGGTHVGRTGDIALFKIVGESGVAAGIRRIEALTGEAARAFLTDRADTLSDAATLLRSTTSEVPGRVAALLEDRKRLEKELSDVKRALAMAGGGGDSDSGETHVSDIGGVKFIGRRLDGVSPKDLRGMVDDAKRQVGSGIVALIAVNEGKAALAAGVTEDMIDKYDAVELIRIGAAAIGGKGGGGRPDMAQAGGPDGDKADEALSAIKDAIAQKSG